MSEVGSKRQLEGKKEPDSKNAKLSPLKIVMANEILVQAMWDNVHWEPAMMIGPTTFYWEPTKFWLKNIICGFLVFLLDQLEKENFSKETKHEKLINFYLSKLGPAFSGPHVVKQFIAEVSSTSAARQLDQPAAEAMATAFPEIIPNADAFIILARFIYYLVQSICIIGAEGVQSDECDSHQDCTHNAVITIDMIKKAIKKESGELFKYPVDLDDWGYCLPWIMSRKMPLDSSNHKPKKQALFYWWKCAENRNRIITQWMKGYKGNFLWKFLHARPLAFLGRKPCPHDQLETVEEHEAIVSVIDGRGKEHILYFSVNPGDADGNTGIFGRVSSEEGVWMLFRGECCGDTTDIESTNVAIKSFYPHKSYDPIPASLAFVEAECSRQHQVESLCFHLAFLVMRKNVMYENYLPLRFKKSLLLSLLLIIHKKAKEEKVSSEAELNLSDLPSELVCLIVSFCEPPELPLLEKTQLEQLSSCKDEELDNLLIDKSKTTIIDEFEYEKNVEMFEAAQSKDTSDEIAQLGASDMDLLYQFEL